MGGFSGAVETLGHLRPEVRIDVAPVIHDVLPYVRGNTGAGVRDDVAGQTRASSMTPP